MKFTCEHCDRVVEVADAVPGEIVVCGSCSEPTTLPDEFPGPGTVLGEWCLERALGEGGEGTVYFARSVKSQAPAAVKVLAPERAQSPHSVDRFLHEAELARNLRHPNLVHVSQYGEEDGFVFCVMEMVEGLSLDKVLIQKGRLGTELALMITEKVVEGLRFAWEQSRVVHCDVKPGNIILTPDRGVKLTDLGLAVVVGEKSVDEDDGCVVGTPQYIAPERLQGAAADSASDIYSLGCTLYHLITGRHAFPAASDAPAEEVAQAHLNRSMTPPNLVVPDVPLPLALLVQGMTARRPFDRYGRFLELLEDITRVREGKLPLHRAPEAAQSASAPEASESAPPRPTAAAGDTPRRAPRGLAWLWHITRPAAAATKPSRPPSPAPRIRTAPNPTGDPETASRPWWDWRAVPYTPHPMFEAIDDHDLFCRLVTKLDAGAFPLIDIPRNIQQTLQILNEPEFDYGRVLQLIAQSPSISAQFLRMANSATLSRGLKISDLRLALTRLGPTTVRAMLYLNTAQAAIGAKGPYQEIAQGIVNHSMAVAAVSRRVCPRLYPAPEEAAMAGLLHDIGKLAVVRVLCEDEVLARSAPAPIAETTFDQILPALHERAGAMLARHWHLPPVFSCAIAHHHSYFDLEFAQASDREFRIACIVSFCDAIARLLGHGRPVNGINLFDLDVCRLVKINDDSDTMQWLNRLAEAVRDELK